MYQSLNRVGEGMAFFVPCIRNFWYIMLLVRRTLFSLPLLFFLWACQPPAEPPIVQNGELSLINKKLTKIRTVKAEGEYLFVWNDFVSFTEAKDKGTLVPIPKAWNSYTWNGVPIGSNGYATFAFHIIPPTSLERPLGVEFTQISTAYRFFINNTLIEEVGIVGKTRETSTATFENRIYLLPQADTLQLVFHVSNFHTKNGGVWHAPVVGEYASLTKSRQEAIYIDFFLMGSLLIIGLYHLSLFFYRTQDRSTLYFAVFCLVIAVRTLVLSKFNLTQYWDWYDWELREKSSYLTFLLGTALFAAFLRHLFPKEFPKKVFWVIQSFYLLLSVFVVLTPNRIFSYGLSIMQLGTLLIVLYGMYVLILSVRRRRNGSGLFLFGFLPLILGVINDILFANGIISTGFIFSFGLLGFVFIQAVLLSARFSKAFHRAELLSEELNTVNKNLEQTVLQRTQTLQETTQILETKNKNITDSINYARRIQQAVLPTQAFMSEKLSEHFVFFVPRDVVSGDFYWCSQVGDKVVLAVADCTGHGVPGAFMSMLGSELLNQIVNQQQKVAAHEILYHLHLEVRRALQQRETDNREGMDISIVVLRKNENLLEFAGAKGQLVYIQQGVLQHIKGDKMPIGGEQREKERKFTEHIVHIASPTHFYLFSDGFQDQFGGEEGRKFTPKRLRQLLARIHQQPMDAQHKQLATALNAWMGSERQVDDILVIGGLVQPKIIARAARK